MRAEPDLLKTLGFADFLPLLFPIRGLCPPHFRREVIVYTYTPTPPSSQCLVFLLRFPDLRLYP